MPATRHTLGRHDVDRLIRQVKSLEARSGRPALRIQIDAPVAIDPDRLVEDLRKELGTEVEIGVTSTPKLRSCRVATIDFEWLRGVGQ